MSNEEKLFDRSMRWTRTFRTRTTSNPSLYQAYAAGWKAAMREQRKQMRVTVDIARRLSGN